MLYWINHHSNRFCYQLVRTESSNRLIRFVIGIRHEKIGSFRVSETKHLTGVLFRIIFKRKELYN